MVDTAANRAEALLSLQTIPELLALRVRSTPDDEAFRQFDHRTNTWESLSYRELETQVERWRRALAAMDLPRGARVAMLLPNGIDAICFDQAVLANGLVPVPLHAIDTPGSVAYILNDCGAAALVTAKPLQWNAIAATGIEFPQLRQVVLTEEIDCDGAPGPVPVFALEDWLARGRAVTELPAPPTPSDLAAIVYTSGTTGRPKGVMLTHRNIMSNVQAVTKFILPMPGDVFLSFLPLSHTFERTAGYYLPLAMGCTVVFTRSIQELGEDFRIVRPTVLISVPRIYERIYGKVQDKLARAGRFKRYLFDWAVEVGWRRFCQRNGLPQEESGRAMLDPLVWPLLDKLIAAPMRAQFGGRMRIAISGGAALSGTVARCFLGLGVPVLQGYGMTETSPVVAVNQLDDNHPATVGHPFHNLEIRLGDNDELQVRGASVMQGYWGRPEDTAAVLSADGWLSTGDQADLSDGGRIRIKGRIKEIIVTSTGEKIPPGDLELAIADDPLFDQVFVVGENRPYIGAIVVLNPEEWQRFAATLELDPNDPASLKSSAARHAAVKRVRAAAREFPHYGVPRNVALTLEPWNVDNGLMTPTLKLKRPQLREKFKDTIAELYSGHRRP